MKIQGPIEVELKISITDDKQHGVVTIGIGIGCYPTEADLRERVTKFELEEMPDGFRLMNKREWFNSVIPTTYEDDEDGNRFPIRYAVPGGDDWDA